MSADAATAGRSAGTPHHGEAARARRQALRIAFAVATGMAVQVAAGAVMPFLAPLFAAQVLVASRTPQRPGQAIGMAVLIIGVGQVLALVVALLGDRPLVFLPLLWLLYLGCFQAQARGTGGAVASLVLVVAIIATLMEVLNRDLGTSLLAVLAAGVVGGSLLGWAAHALFPDPGGPDPAPPDAAPAGATGLRQAGASATILLAAVVLCLVDGDLASATVIPITVASILGQLSLATSRRAAFGLLLVNILGGVAASLVALVIAVRPSLPVLFLVVFLAGLGFGSRAAADPIAGRIFAGALTTFLILLGLGISPLPGTTADSFATRVTYVSAAALYALWAGLLLWPRPAAAAHGV